ncbi:MAG: amidohydrolase family protein [Deltaproteobacteria bacterium]|nr:amidohydrolase family protein [Deltaproteobacteria bacterium]
MTESVFAKLIYTGKALVQDAHLQFDGREILGVSRTRKGALLGRFEVLTPAFIDAHSHIGMARAGEPQAEAEANDQMDPVLALADALDSLQMDDTALRDAVESGVLYSCILPGSGNIIGGLSAVIRNYAETTTDALLARAGIKAAFGYNPMSTRDWKGRRPTTRMGAAALLRRRLDEVIQKQEKRRRAKGKAREDILFSAEEKVLGDVLSGKTALRAHVHKIDDIALVLRLADDFKFRVCVEHAMDVHEPRIFAELKKRRIPVVYGPLDSFAYKVELKHENWRNIRHLLDTRVAFGLMSDHPVTPAAQILLQTRWFLRSGLSKQEAVGLITRRNAEILGIHRFAGTLEPGKWASFVCWNGDPFDLTSYPVAVYGEGRELYGE